MHRTISDYKITKRKDGRYYVRIRDNGTKKMIKRKEFEEYISKTLIF